MSETKLTATGSAVTLDRIPSGFKVNDSNTKETSSPSDTAVQSVVSEVDKARETVERVTKSSAAHIEVIHQNQDAARVRVTDVEEAAKLAKGLKFNIQSNEELAIDAHDINRSRAKELLK